MNQIHLLSSFLTGFVFFAVMGVPLNAQAAEATQEYDFYICPDGEKTPSSPKECKARCKTNSQVRVRFLVSKTHSEVLVQNKKAPEKHFKNASRYKGCTVFDNLNFICERSTEYLYSMKKMEDGFYSKESYALKLDGTPSESALVGACAVPR